MGNASNEIIAKHFPNQLYSKTQQQLINDGAMPEAVGSLIKIKEEGEKLAKTGIRIYPFEVPRKDKLTAVLQIPGF